MHACSGALSSHSLLAGNVHAWQILALSVALSSARADAVLAALRFIIRCGSLEACTKHATSATSLQALLGCDTDELSAYQHDGT